MRRANVVRLVIGALALARPQLAVHAVGAADGIGVRGTTRVLGLRYVVHALVERRLDRRWARELGAAVELLHGGSMLVLAGTVPRHRRLALVSAAIAVSLAADDLTGQRSGPCVTRPGRPPSGGPPRR
jgi:hypothetical protein